MRQFNSLLYWVFKESGTILSIGCNVRMFACLCVCPLNFLTLFNGLFVPNSQSPMYQLFRYYEFLGKSNGKKWSQI